MNLLSDPISKLLGEWSTEINTYTILLRLGIAMIAAAIIGCERARKRHAAGLRTFILVSASGASAMLLDLFLMGNTPVKLPILSAAALLSVAMLSGNSVLFSAKNQIKGLTTSVGLWSCELIGLAAGAGFYTAALILSLLLLVFLSYLQPIEIYLKNRSNHFEIHLELKSKQDLQDFVTVTRKLGMNIDLIEANNAYVGSGLSVYTVTFTIVSKELKKYKTHREIIEALRSLDYIYYIEEMN